MKHKTYFSLLSCLSLLACGQIDKAQAQTLATFEEGIASKVELVKPDGYKAELFSVEPQVVDNPDVSGINKSAKCLGATNVANADWWGNFIQLELSKPVTISESNRYLSLMVYRSIQPKEMRIGINGRESSDEVFYGKLDTDARWQQLEIDLMGKYAGKTLNSIWVIFSCNWSDPRSGWGEAAYFIDNVKLSGTPLPVAVTIDPSKKYQTIEGFSASDCWAGNYVGQWKDEVRNDVAKWLFSQGEDAEGNAEGAGLSMWRINLGAGTAEQGDASGIEDKSRRAECFLSADGTYNWDKSAGQQFFMRKAAEYGCEKFVAFSNSAPVFMNKNGKGFANKGGVCNLKSDKFDAFAEYMATVAEHFAAEGISIDYISPVNEPQYDWTDGQEGCPWDNADIAKLAKALDAQIVSKGLSTQILLTEGAEWNYIFKNSSGHAKNQLYALWDTKSASYIGGLQSLAPYVGGHSYWTFGTNSQLREVRTGVWDAAQKYGVGLFQTEWSLLDKEPSTETGFPANYDKASFFDIALFMAKVIHSDMVFANCASWSYWTAMDVERWGHKNRFLMVNVVPADGSYGDIAKSGTASPTANVWVLGNYARFVRPGFTRVELSGADNMNGLVGSAYLSPDGKQLVAVYVNTSSQPVEASFDVAGLGKPLSVDVYLTKEGTNLKHISHGDYVNKRTFDARSVTTVVYNYEGQSNALCTPKSVANALRISPNMVGCGESVAVAVENAGCEASELISVDGRVVARLDVKGGSFVVPSVPAGAYFVRLGNSIARLFVK